ncbi:MAG TPA: cytochrome c [Saprospiraceae bacterium]|nr:cytochrome c [Saprospiraceae bacterium]
MKRNVFSIPVCIAIAGIIACSPAGSEKRGHEFMPDMVHSTAYEANIYEYYYYNTWGTEEEYKNFTMPRTSVPGTIARGNVGAALSATPEERLMAYHAFAGERSLTGITMAANGSVPYPYQDTEADRIRASKEILQNPYPITAVGLEYGKALYTIYCGICHGEKGDGLGYLVREEDPAKGIRAGVYPAAPANFMKEAFLDTTNGFFYHSIMYGKNMMGSYADKLSFEERWKVIHYIRSLQAKTKELVYNENENTYTNDVPGGPILKKIKEQETKAKTVETIPPADSLKTEESGVQGEH